MFVSTDQINVIDLEATCWKNHQVPHGQRNEIIEVGIAVVDTQSLEIIEEEGMLVTPVQSEVSEFCQELTSLTPGKLHAEGKQFSEVCTRLANHYSTEKYPWASWGLWDEGQLREDCDAKDIAYPMSNEHLNLKMLYGLYCGKEHAPGLGKALGDDFEGTQHRGVDDARNEAKLLLEILR